ncbi:thioredoxin domain-containing protein [Hyalangium rubrum]|uniref:Thioredoxin domain-containing protein n=1 Tax=Hyalangium rubrum TaxID=3103134 RepID=A0ABU5H294_9BACT|nr:thioredoxin domain-containing protein [Hyalangium sp. s54d21]MDY7227227.1 thioredoxin domain-containing protein [Hyalangium sp. s54d21]
MSKKANPPPPVPFRGAVALLVLGLAESALALFQWRELLTLRGGGTTVCGVSQTINCETVWNTSFASRVHETLGIPVAGLGLLWGLVATGLAGLYLAWRSSGHTVRPATNGLRLTAAAGVLSTVVFAAVSASTGALCPTCLGTYGLVLAFAAVAWRGLPGPVVPLAGEWGRALKWTVGFAVAGFVALLGPGRATPKLTPAEEALPQLTADAGSLEAYLRGLDPREQQMAASALAQYRHDQPLPARAPARRRFGSAEAPVKVVEWTDSKCPHCKMLVEAVAALKKRLPEGKLSLEARQYPLDGACNPSIPPQHTDVTGTRCVAAKAQICLENAPDFWELREKLFQAQAGLNAQKVMEIASSGSMNRSQLEACVNSPDTAVRIQEDVSYAQQHDIHGTPLVVVNGREVPPSVPFLYVLAMVDGDANAPAFKVLPPAPPVQAHAH